MRRLCIYVTYDFENIADDYIGYMLHELRKVADCLVVVCNYEYIAKGINNIQPFADKIYYRKNIGFDAGAYKDALCQYLGWSEISCYDELLLINDSFYGPIYPVEDWFRNIENVDTDYWGMIRAPQGKFADGFVYNAHIQSYFLAFRKTVLRSSCFRRYWEELEYPRSLYEAVKEFEIGCNKYLENNGFKGAALTDIYQTGYRFQENEIPYMQHSFELIRDFRVPILKRRGLYFSNRGFANALEAFKYIENTNIYDSQLIKQHFIRISHSVHDEGILDLLRLSNFYNEHARIYFYGAGVYGQNLSIFFKYMGWTFDGFLVTNAESQKENCKVFNKMELNSNDGIIIAVGKKDMCFEILDIVKKRCNEDQIMYPNF